MGNLCLQLRSPLQDWGQHEAWPADYEIPRAIAGKLPARFRRRNSRGKARVSTRPYITAC